MPIAKFLKGGTVTFNSGGTLVSAGPGFVGDVPQRILDRYKKQGRFEILEQPALLANAQTTDMKRGEIQQRDAKAKPAAREAQKDAPKAGGGKYIERHKGFGTWRVVELSTGTPATETEYTGENAKAEAKAEADRLNAEAGDAA